MGQERVERSTARPSQVHYLAAPLLESWQVVVVGAPGETRTPSCVSLRGRCHAIRRRRLGMGAVVEGGFEPPVALSCGGFTDR
jgi:hypothetical protein